MRESCLNTARVFGQSGDAQHRAAGAKGVEDFADLFAKLLPGDANRRSS